MKKNNTTSSNKRNQIIAAASTLFLRNGYKATSMDAIVREAGVSKPTLYSHFQNKEQLFAKIACGMCNEYCDTNCDPKTVCKPDEELSLEDVLKRMGNIFLNQMIMQPQGLAMLRMALSESPQFPELGHALWDTGINRLNLSLSDYLKKFNDDNILKIENVDLAAKQFLGLVVGPYLLPVLLGIQTPPQQEEVDNNLARAITLFLDGVK